MIKIFAKASRSLSKKRLFCYFGENIFKIIASVPECHFISFHHCFVVRFFWFIKGCLSGHRYRGGKITFSFHSGMHNYLPLKLTAYVGV
jgi:hypothetical protein